LDEVQDIADFTGDSLELSRQAVKVDAKVIVFCGVHFMAETADMLKSPGQAVILPDLEAGCSMADMADISSVEECWKEIGTKGDILPITYINSTADIKAFCGKAGGAICTSSNAKAVISWAFNMGKRVLFLPDEHLGRNSALSLGVPLDKMAVWDHSDGEIENGDPDNAKILLWKAP
jgi:quinolinate synthase